MMLLCRTVWRSLASAPLVPLVAVLSLALGIGANTAIFSIVNGLMLRPLPVRDPDQLVLVTSSTDRRGTLTHPIWEQIRDHQDLFGGTAAWASEQFNISARGQSEFVDGLFVSGAFLDVMGLHAVLGRGISPGDDGPAGGPDGPAAMISYSFWQRRFGSDPGVVGRSLTIGGHPLTIVGVAPPGFFGLEVGRAFDVAVPFAVEPMLHANPSFLSSRTAWWLNVVMRRKADQSLAEATAALRGIQSRVREATIPQTYTAEEAATYLTVPLELQPVARGVSRMRERYQRPLMTIMVVYGLQPRDPLTLAGGAIVLVTIGALAGWIPARRAARIDPAHVLRQS
jgi:putative ABC transport system permease protein